MKKEINSPLGAIMGTHRSPSTLDVISICHKTDRMLKVAAFYEEERARSEEVNKDLDAIREQIEWLWDSEESASTELDKDAYIEAIDYLLSLCDEIRAAYGLDRPKKPPPPTIGEILYVPVAYLLRVLLNTILYLIFTATMIVVVFVAVFLFFKTL